MSSFVKKVKYSLLCVLSSARYYIGMPFEKYSIRVCDVDETINELVTTEKSIVRFGDGETTIIRGHSIKFQNYSKKLSDELETVLSSEFDNLMVAIPDVFNINHIKKLKKNEQKAWIRDLFFSRNVYVKNCNKNQLYYTSLVSRLYLPYKISYDVTGKRFEQLKKVWDNRKILIIEGKDSKLGVGNDLFDNAEDIKRIICPNKNAYDCCHLIVDKASEICTDYLIILALGPTAKIVSYQLFLRGFRTLDLGHLDIEYEWYLMKTDRKVAVGGKEVNEVEKNENIKLIENNNYKEQEVFFIDKN